MAWKKIIVADLNDNHEFLFQFSRDQYGVYIVRSSTEICRLKGKSDILYIGKGKIKHRLIALLDPHFRETKRKHSAKQDLKRLITEEGFIIYIKYLFFDTNDLAKKKEKDLLKKYCLKHIEPPPLNHTRK